MGNGPENEPCVAGFLALDAEISGNSQTSVGPLDVCIEVAAGAGVAVDLVVEIPDVADPASDGLAAWQVLLSYDSDILTLGSIDRSEGLNMLAANPASSLFNPPPTDIDPVPPAILFFGSQDVGGGAAAEDGLAGVLARLNLTVAGAGDQFAFLNLLPAFDVNASKLITVDNDTYGIANFPGGASQGEGLQAIVAISPATCENAPQPTPQPTPTPTPAPTATPTPGPTPTPAPEATPTPTPAPTADPAATPTPTPTPTPTLTPTVLPGIGLPTLPTPTPLPEVLGASQLPSTGSEPPTRDTAVWLGALAVLLLLAGAAAMARMRSRR